MEGLLQKLPGPIQRAISKLPGRAKTVVAIVALGAAGLSPAVAQDTQQYPLPTPVSRGYGRPAPNPNDFPIQDMGSASIPDDHPQYGKNPRELTPAKVYPAAPADFKRAVRTYCEFEPPPPGTVIGDLSQLRHVPPGSSLSSGAPSVGFSDNNVNKMYADIKASTTGMSDKDITDAIIYFCKGIA